MFQFLKLKFTMRFNKMMLVAAMLLPGSVVFAQQKDSTVSKQLEEVIVTANKREENIIKVNTSITSLSSKKIEDTRTWGLSGLSALVPNYITRNWVFRSSRSRRSVVSRYSVKTLRSPPILMM